MKRWVRRTVKILGGLIIAVLLILALLILGLQNDRMRGIVVDRIISEVNRSLEGTIEVDAVEGPLLGAADLRGVRVIDGRGNLAADVDLASVRFRVLPLLVGRVIVDRIDVDGATLVVRTYGDDVLNWQTLTEPDPEPTEPSEIPIFVDLFTFNDVALAYFDETAEVDAEVEGLGRWRRLRRDDLDDVESGAELRRRWQEAFDEMPDHFADPRGPLALWLTELATSGQASVFGPDIEAEVAELTGTVQADMLPQALETTLSALAVQMGETTLRATLGAVEVENWLHVDDFSLGMVLPPRFPPGNGEENDIGGVADPTAVEEAPFDLLYVDLGRWSLFERPISWAAPEVEVVAPLFLSGQLIMDPISMQLIADIDHDEAAQPVELSLRLDDYTEEVPQFFASLTARDFHPHRWVFDPEIVAVETNLRLHVEGRGFDPEDMEVELRARLDDTVVDDTYHAHLIHAEISMSDGVVHGRRVSALTPYLDLFASFRFDPDGHAQLRARTTADPEQAERAAEFAEIRPSEATLSLDAEAHFDPQIEDFMDSLESLTASASWRFADFEAEEIVIGSSRGEAALNVDRVVGVDEPDYYDGTYSINTSGQNVTFEDFRARTLEFRDRGRLALQLPIDDPIDSLHTFDNNATFAATGLRTPDLTIRRINLTLDGEKPHRGRRLLGARVVGQIQGMETDDVVVETVDADFYATVDLGQEGDAFDVIDAFYLDGQASAVDVESQDFLLSRAEVTAQLQGRLDRPTGTIEAELTDLYVADEYLPRAIAEITLEDTRVGSASLQAWRRDEESYFAQADFGFGPRYETFVLSDLDLGTERVSWTSSPDSLIRWTGDRLEFDQFLLESDDQSLFVDGQFTPDRNQDLEVAIEGLDFGRLRWGFYLEEHMPEVAGWLKADIDFAGTAARPTLDMRSEIRDFHFEDNGPFSTVISAAYDDEVFHLRRMTATAFGEELIEATASLPVAVDLDGRAEVLWDREFDLRMRFAPLELSQFHDSIPILDDYNVDGSMGGFLEANGRVDDPRLAFEFTLQGFQFQGEVDGDFLDVRDVDLVTHLHYESPASGGDGLYLFSDVTWESETALELLVDAPLPLEEWLQAALDPDEELPQWRDELIALPMRFRLQVPNLDLARIPLESLREQNVMGEANIDIDLRGSVDDPQGRIDVELADIGWDRFRNLSFDFNTRLRDQRADFERLRFEWGDDEIFVADGSIPLPISAILAGEAIEDIPLSFRWQLRELPISRLSAIDYDFARIRGTMAAFVELSGTLRNPRFKSRAGIFNTRLGDGQPGTIFFEIEGANNEITLNGGVCHRLDTFLSFDGRAPVLMDLVELAQGADWQLPGELEFHARTFMENDERDADEIVTITIDGVREEIHKLNVADLLPVQLIDDYVVDPEGLFALLLRAEGTWEDPEVAGFFLLEDAALTLPEFSRRFVNIGAAVEFDDHRIIIDRFHVEDGPGEINLAGTIDHELFIPEEIDLRVTADQFNIGGLGVDFPVFITGNAAIAGQPLGEANSPGQLSVDVTGLHVELTDELDAQLHATELDDDIVIVDRNMDQRVPAAELIDADEDGIAEMLHVIIEITVAPNSRLGHPVGDIFFGADLTAEISGNLVIMSGTVDARSGEVEFLGRRFSIQESQITFVGAVPPNPRLQLEAHHILDRAVTQALGPPSTGEPRIIFRITGSAEDPRLELSSDPLMTQTDILFVLMTGRPPDQTGVGQDAGVANQALAAVSGVFVGMLQEELAEWLPLDVVRIEPGEAGLRGARLELGYYIGSDVFVSYRRRLGATADEDTAANIFRLEYHFLPRWMMELNYTDRNEGRLNFFWDVY